MSTEILFRAWHEENKTMVYFDPDKLVTDQYQMLALAELMASKSEFLMQYVNVIIGKVKIYQGDILRLTSYDDDWITKVRACGEIDVIDSEYDFTLLKWATYDNVEVIGNIYEDKIDDLITRWDEDNL